MLQLHCGKLICTAYGFKQIYEITITKDGDSFELSSRPIKLQRKPRTARAQSVVVDSNRSRRGISQSEGEEIEIYSCEISHSQNGDLIYIAYKTPGIRSPTTIAVCQIDHQYSSDNNISLVLSEQRFVLEDYNVREIYYCAFYDYLFLRDEEARIHPLKFEPLDRSAAVQISFSDSTASGEGTGSPQHASPQHWALQSFSSVPLNVGLPMTYNFPRAVCVDDNAHSLLLVSIERTGLSIY